MKPPYNFAKTFLGTYEIMPAVRIKQLWCLHIRYGGTIILSEQGLKIKRVTLVTDSLWKTYRSFQHGFLAANIKQ
jgi:hypothetical protein